MKKEKKIQNEVEQDEGGAIKSLMEKYMVEANENNVLRAHSRHSMRLGTVELDIIPTDKTQSLEDVMKQFAKFAKLMHKLHGNAHLSAIVDEKSPLGNMAGMFE